MEISGKIVQELEDIFSDGEPISPFDEDTNIYDISGGNYDDAYNIGYHEGYQVARYEMAHKILSELRGSV